jgi:hypothetical protein
MPTFEVEYSVRKTRKITTTNYDDLLEVLNIMEDTPETSLVMIHHYKIIEV